MQISVIIPCNHRHIHLNRTVASVCSQAYKPYELVIIDSSGDRGDVAGIASACENNGIRLHYQAVDHAFPGMARNMGIQLAQSPWVAFIDVHTIPRPDWLAKAVRQIEAGELDGVFGATVFEGITFIGRLYSDGLFGMLPRRTLPGSVFHRRVIAKAGILIPWVRAGEDTDWMSRVKLMRLRVNDSVSVTTDYIGLRGLRIRTLLIKWVHYYASSESLPHIFPQKVLVWLLIYPIFILIALNWNNLAASWRVDSPWYVPNVTKFVVAIPPLLYMTLRGLVIPVRRGVPLRKLLPLRFILIALLCGMLDLIKVAIFLFPSPRNGKGELTVGPRDD